ncbi:hypothetical protein [Escherichia coli]|uniref:hypothetical protein n=1 Tax=Escherichia coli TaxID=562 RepID=UPI00346727A6
MNKNTHFSPEVRQRAIHMVLESQDDYDSLWGGIWIDFLDGFIMPVHIIGGTFWC